MEQKENWTIFQPKVAYCFNTAHEAVGGMFLEKLVMEAQGYRE